MTVEKAGRLARRLMNRHGLKRWAIVWVDSRRRAGRCVRPLRTLLLSRPFAIWVDPADWREIVLHEVAHALTAGSHNEVWKETLRRIGGSGKTVPLVSRLPPRIRLDKV